MLASRRAEATWGTEHVFTTQLICRIYLLASDIVLRNIAVLKYVSTLRFLFKEENFCYFIYRHENLYQVGIWDGLITLIVLSLGESISSYFWYYYNYTYWNMYFQSYILKEINLTKNYTSIIKLASSYTFWFKVLSVCYSIVEKIRAISFFVSNYTKLTTLKLTNHSQCTL